MDEPIRQRLLQLNREFYTTVAAPFDKTRQGWTPGKLRLLDTLREAESGLPLQVADVGCGNGRFALMLDSLGVAIRYIGVDGNEHLLERAAEQTASLANVERCFVHADLAQAGWSASLPSASFEMVVCLATLQHMPSYELRFRLVRDLASLLAPNGLLAISAWQFLESERFRKRLIDWSEIGLTAADVDPGDALLPWKQGAYAVRYVHQTDEIELNRLVADAGLTIVDTYRADGKEGNLNLYAILKI